MTLYAGLDVSTRETAICVVDGTGSVVWEGKVPTTVEAIADALAARAAGIVRVGMETGPVSVWLWHGLRRVGIAVDCIHARRAAAALKLQTNKTDRNDARGLAQLVRSGWYEPVAVKSMATYRVRAILVAREQIVGMCTALINKIRGLAKTFGVIVAPGKAGAFDRAVRRAMPPDPIVSDLFETLLATLSGLRDRRRAFDLWTVAGGGEGQFRRNLWHGAHSTRFTAAWRVLSGKRACCRLLASGPSSAGMLTPGGSYVLYIQCSACRHLACVPEDAFLRAHGVDPEAAWFDALAPRLRCSECGAKGGSDVRKVWAANGSFAPTFEAS